LLLSIYFRTKQNLQQRKAEEEHALDQKLAEETHHATSNDEVERQKRKVRFVYDDYFFAFVSEFTIDYVQMELRNESQHYRAYVEQRKLDEQRQQAELDRILQAELNRQNAKRAEKVREEKEKRTKLLREVVEGRQQQLVDRSELLKRTIVSLSYMSFVYFIEIKEKLKKQVKINGKRIILNI
jgi:hypothetical protein